MPQEWKNATLVPLFKKKEGKICDNYWEIFLLSVPGKVLAQVLLERLQTIIDPQQRNGGPMWVQEGMWHHGSAVGGTSGGGESYRVQDTTVPVFLWTFPKRMTP